MKWKTNVTKKNVHGPNEPYLSASIENQYRERERERVTNEEQRKTQKENRQSEARNEKQNTK